MSNQFDHLYAGRLDNHAQEELQRRPMFTMSELQQATTHQATKDHDGAEH
jgi:hypothetical protein